jgi:CheY-like chemotaxis protein
MRARVLLVDDSRFVTRSMAYRLKLSGYEPMEVSDPLLARETAHQFRPHAIILDFQMPGMNGVEVARQFADDPLLKDIPILLCSASPEQIPRSELPRELPVLRKPLATEMLLEWLGAQHRDAEHPIEENNDL